MQFGKTEHTGGIDFSLLPDSPALAKVLGGQKAATHVYVGGVLWADERFKGIIYPGKAKASDFVKHYTAQFNTIELNATHYRVPPAETFVKWKQVAPEGFRFCPKIHQSISHAEDLRRMIGFHNQCADLFALLEHKLGACFMQLPPHFSDRRLPELIEFLDNSELRNVSLELRHASWFTNTAAFNQLSNFLYKNGMGLVITDTPGRRDVVHMRLTNTKALVRFKAVGHEATDRERMLSWLERLKAWQQLGLEEFYFFIHTADKSEMPYLAVFFIEELHRICGISIKPPELYKRNNELF